MRIAEEPFLTRESILSVLKPGGATTDRPFRTLRKHSAASEGLTVPVRTPSGHMLGRVSLYSSLNGDAARAYRLNRVELAQELVARATEIEKSQAAELIRDAVETIAGSMPIDPLSSDAHPSLRRYLDLRRRSSWRGLDWPALAREWMTHSSAWLDAPTGNRDQRVDAVEALDRQAQKARAELMPDEGVSVSTFFGIVRRMDVTAAELESETKETILLPRDDLERQGLAVVGQAVSLLREVMPNGGAYCLPMPAVALDEPIQSDRDSPWNDISNAMAIPLSPLTPRDADWLDRELAREPKAVPVGPLRVA